MEQSTIRISLVEDSKTLTKTLEKEIDEIQDIDLISSYDNAEDAIRYLVKDKPDVVIMDIGLPQMNGIECLMRIQKKSPQISFLMFTIYENSEHVIDSLKAGAMGYILKRDGTEGVIKGVRELIAGGAPMSRNIARKVLKSFQPPEHLVESLSPRELEVLNLLSKGFQYKEIAVKLNPQIDVGTVKQHIHRIYKKLQVNNRTEAINKFFGRKRK